MKIFWKTFYKVVGVLSVGIILLHMIVFFTYPTFYRHNQTEQIKKRATVLVQYLEQKNANEIRGILEAYSQNTDITVHLKDDVARGSIDLIHDLEVDPNSGNKYVLIEEQLFTTADGKRLLLQFVMAEDIFQQALQTAFWYLPYTFIATLLFAIVFSYVYSKEFVQPLEYLLEVTKKMENLELDASFQEDDDTEIGMIGRQMNRVYFNLLATMEESKKRYEKIHQLEQQKVAYIRGASHEFKTPLASLRILLENMRENIGKYRDHRFYLGECLREVDRLHRLVQEVLVASRFEEWTKDQQGNNLQQSIAAELEHQRIQAEEKQLSIVSKIPKEVQVQMNPRALQRLLSNIIGNAINYSEECGIVRIEWQESILFVENECLPLEKEELEKLFMVFYHAQVPKKGHYGSGLGLYIVKNILESYELEYHFTPTGNGMMFQIDFDKIIQKKVGEKDGRKQEKDKICNS